jgi:hypothetical protein
MWRQVATRFSVLSSQAWLQASDPAEPKSESQDTVEQVQRAIGGIAHL